MKKRSFTIITITLTVLVLASCKNAVTTGNKEVDKLFKENPVTINWVPTENHDIESFSADVSIYEINNRTGNEAKLQSKYRMSFKNIGNRICNRVDLESLIPNEQAYSAIYSGDETIIFEPKTEQVLYRITDTNNELAELDFLNTETAISRINLSLIKDTAKRLAFDIAEDETTNKLEISLPSKYFATEYAKRISTKIRFDTVNEVLAETETIEIRQDGTKITVTMQALYEEKNGEPIKIGTVTTIETDSPVVIDAEGIEWFESPEDVPEISDAEYERLKEIGAIEEVENMTFGDPTSLDSVQIIVEIYNDIEINNVSDRLFRLLD